ncbi:ClpP/crotonase-like domain-containing protein [Circinella umbellata]|nr:ClpP/crotonase-like domain-containing protein [Circinella umbellata]
MFKNFISTSITKPLSAQKSVRSFSTGSVLRQAAAASTYQHILTETRGKVALVTLNRPKALNALCNDLFTEINDAMKNFDDDENIGAIVLTGSEKAFAAGADIKEMKDNNFVDTYKKDFLGHWAKISDVKKPIIAAVNGYALGGGCELAMSCDIIYAGEKAVFGQPEINLGIIPGAGGTQRLVRAVGKSRAMEMVLGGGANLTATEAQSLGLVSKVVPADQLIDEAVKTAGKIASKSQASVQMGKELINKSFEVPLSAGLRWERAYFQALFGTADQKEGMGAFAEKRKPNFTNN